MFVKDKTRTIFTSHILININHYQKILKKQNEEFRKEKKIIFVFLLVTCVKAFALWVTDYLSGHSLDSPNVNQFTPNIILYLQSST